MVTLINYAIVSLGPMGLVSFYFLGRMKEHNALSLEGGILVSASERCVGLDGILDYDVWMLWYLEKLRATRAHDL